MAWAGGARHGHRKIGHKNGPQHLNAFDDPNNPWKSRHITSMMMRVVLVHSGTQLVEKWCDSQSSSAES